MADSHVQPVETDVKESDLSEGQLLARRKERKKRRQERLIQGLEIIKKDKEEEASNQQVLTSSFVVHLKITLCWAGYFWTNDNSSWRNLEFFPPFALKRRPIHGSGPKVFIVGYLFTNLGDRELRATPKEI